MWPDFAQKPGTSTKTMRQSCDACGRGAARGSVCIIAICAHLTSKYVTSTVPRVVARLTSRRAISQNFDRSCSVFVHTTFPWPEASIQIVFDMPAGWLHLMRGGMLGMHAAIVMNAMSKTLGSMTAP